MKYLITVLALFFYFQICAQDGSSPQSTESTERKNALKFKEEDKNAERLADEDLVDSRSLYNYSVFNKRKDLLLSNGKGDSQLAEDQEIKALVESEKMLNEGSHAYNMMQYWVKGRNLEEAQYLLNAYNINPNESESYDELMEYAAWKNDENFAEEIAIKIKAANKYASDIYQYSKDLLQSLPEDAVLITNGEIETICTKVLQLTEGTSNGIKVIRKDWLEESRYSEQALRDIGLAISNRKTDNRPLIQNLIESNPNKSFYLSLTLTKTDLIQFQDKLYLIGLAYQYSNHSIDNLPQIESNWETIYDKRGLSDKSSSYYGSKLLSNYLLSGIKLYFYLEENKKKNKAKAIKDKLYKIALLSGQSERIKAWL